MILSRKTKVFSIVLIVAVLATAFVYSQVSTASQSIEFDLKTIGESVYEAHRRSGKWPSQISDLEGTTYLQMPHRRSMLEQGHFVVVWHQDLDSNPAANRDRILAYDKGSLLARFGWVWACTGDLRVERLDRKQDKR